MDTWAGRDELGVDGSSEVLEGCREEREREARKGTWEEEMEENSRRLVGGTCDGVFRRGGEEEKEAQEGKGEGKRGAGGG